MFVFKFGFMFWFGSDSVFGANRSRSFENFWGIMAVLGEYRANYLTEVLSHGFIWNFLFDYFDGNQDCYFCTFFLRDSMRILLVPLLWILYRILNKCTRFFYLLAVIGFLDMCLCLICFLRVYERFLYPLLYFVCLKIFWRFSWIDVALFLNWK